MLTIEQLKTRASYIGGSDAAAILGLSRWKTPLQVWAEKSGRLAIEQIETLPMRVGKALEETVKNLFQEQTGKTLYGSETEFFHPEHKFLGCHVDALVQDEDAIFEGKTANAYKESEWKNDEIPPEYILQGMHSLAVTGRQKCYYGILIGNHNFQVKCIERDDELIKDVVAKEVDFWNRFIVPKNIPEVITKNDGSILFKLFPEAIPGSLIDLGDEGARLIEMRNALYQDQKNIEGQFEKLNNEIKAKLGSNEAASAGQWLVTLKNQTRPEHVVKASKFRALRIKEQAVASLPL